ncbi:MAG TPA: pitrilysin family protein, partial [Armatimonadota bacterium]|nr:pitrilysin family protein [Armatimonadota bacterium]
MKPNRREVRGARREVRDARYRAFFDPSFILHPSSFSGAPSFVLLCVLSLFCVSCHSSSTDRYGHLLTAGVQRTTLSNGLTLLTKEVPGAPVTSVWIYYRVGSRDDPEGEKGMAHLVEHMTFKGTRRFGPGQLHEILAEYGADANAGTSRDYTDYHETLPNRAVPIALKMEADRMRNCLMDPVQLEREKGVVLSELETEAEDPRRQLEKAVHDTAFILHPYRFPVIGFPDQIRSITRRALYAFYRAYYVPNNAVLVVVGDFSARELRRQAQEDFAKIPSGRVPPRPAVVEPPQGHAKRVVIEAPTALPQVEIAYHTPSVAERDHIVIGVIDYLLASGPSSRLVNDLVDRGVILQAAAYERGFADPGLTEIMATIPAHQSAAAAEAAIDHETDRLCGYRVTKQELAKAIHQDIADFVFRDESVTG